MKFFLPGVIIYSNITDNLLSKKMLSKDELYNKKNIKDNTIETYNTLIIGFLCCYIGLAMNYSVLELYNIIHFANYIYFVLLVIVIFTWNQIIYLLFTFWNGLNYLILVENNIYLVNNKLVPSFIIIIFMILTMIWMIIRIVDSDLLFFYISFSIASVLPFISLNFISEIIRTTTMIDNLYISLWLFIYFAYVILLIKYLERNNPVKNALAIFFFTKLFILLILIFL